MLPLIRGFIWVLVIFTSHSVRHSTWKVAAKCPFDCSPMATAWTGDHYAVFCRTCKKEFVYRGGILYESWAVHSAGDGSTAAYPAPMPIPPEPPRPGRETYADYRRRVDVSIRKDGFSLADLTPANRRMYDKGDEHVPGSFPQAIIKAN